MGTSILFRNSRGLHEELETAKKFFPVFNSRILCKNQLVIARYSALPNYQELEYDLKLNGSKLINTWDQHKWIANFEYYEYLKGFTPETWTEDTWRFCEYEGPFIVKGKTNSRKYQFNTHMFAKDKPAANKISSELRNDMFLGDQEVIYRKYVPLKVFEIGLGGLPFANEWRFFYYKEKLLSYGYYWSIAEDITSPKIDAEGLDLANNIAKIASTHVNFFVMDIAEKQDGGWILIELNDGQMSGLSENNPEELYSNLARELNVHNT